MIDLAASSDCYVGLYEHHNEYTNAISGITTAPVVRCKGILHDIIRVDTSKDYKEGLTLYCSKRARQ